MKIYIPTLGRVEKQITFDNLPDKYKEKVVLVVQEHERSQYKFDVEYMVVDDNIGLSKTRQLIFHKAGKSYYSMLDDDLEFYRRNRKYSTSSEFSDMEGSKRKMTEQDFDEMYVEFGEWFDDGFIQCGHRETSLPPLPTPWQDNVGAYSAYTFDGHKLSTFIDEIDWTYTKVGCDSMWQLEFLLRGCKIRMSDIWTEKSAWWQEGGVALYRDAELYNNEHLKLVKKYPKYVNVTGTVVRNYIGEIINLRYNWKKAYADSLSTPLSVFFK
tara:strand:- start:1471 stop:2277 length:807 start_codon:yes stop_codon:yes gene_type:complete